MNFVSRCESWRRLNSANSIWWFSSCSAWPCWPVACFCSRWRSSRSAAYTSTNPSHCHCAFNGDRDQVRVIGDLVAGEQIQDGLGGRAVNGGQLDAVAEGNRPTVASCHTRSAHKHL